MRALRIAWRTLARNLRSGQLTVLVLALLVAVTALTSVGFFTDRVAKAVARESAVVLAADLRLRASQPPDPAYLSTAKQRGLRTATVTSFPSVVVTDDGSQLAGIYAVGGGYPLRGSVLLSEALFGTQQQATAIPGRGEIWAESGLLARLDVDVGSRVSVGSTEFTITRVLEYRPDQSVGFVGLAPALLMNAADLAATQLIQPGSRVTWSYLFAGEPADVTDFEAFLKGRLAENERLQTVGDTSEQISSAISRAQDFLSLAALIAVLLAAAAVAVTARRYATSQVDGVALMKCMGASQRFVVAVSLIELGLLGVGAGLLGSALGFAAQFGLTELLVDLVQGELPGPGIGPLVGGLVTALAVLTGFALPAMLNLRTVPPLRVLRHDSEPKPLSATLSMTTAIAIVVLLLIWTVGTGQLLMVTLGGLGAGTIALVLAGWLLVRAVSPLRHAAGIAWRYGLANIARRGADSVAQVVAFGFGLAVLLLLSLVRTELLDNWRRSLPADAPNNFLINVQPSEVEGVQEVFQSAGVTPPRLSPLVRGRISAINGAPTDGIEAHGQGRQLLNREANLTWADELDPSNTLVAGRWWTAGTQDAEVSLDDEVAHDLGIEVGDEMTFGIAGETITATVTSLRRIKWDSFRPNFYLVLNEHALTGLPATFISGVYVPRDSRRVLLDLVKQFPSISVIDLESLIEQVRSVMDRAALAVQYVFLFTLLAGIAVLLAAVQATRDERRYEAAMLRTLGASRRVVLKGIFAEFLCLGLLAGALASLVAAGVGYALATLVFRIDYQPDLSVMLAGPLLGAVLVGASGLLATQSVIRTAPVNVLRAH
jgi:putative ABC transport system permease protein